MTFHNAESGFCVLRVKVRGQRDLVTVVGHAATIAAGEWVQMSGSWINDRTHGLQFKTTFLKTSPPTTLEGIEKYLGSGMIRGIGPTYATKLVRAFGAAVFELIEQAPARLREVTGIGPKRAARIVAGWADQKVIRRGSESAISGLHGRAETPACEGRVSTGDVSCAGGGQPPPGQARWD